MDCDNVFMELTRAPFPAESTAARAVERHLRICPDCRRIAEAFRPAPDVSHEALSEAERETLPSYERKAGAPLPLAFAATGAGRRPSTGSRGPGADGGAPLAMASGHARLSEEIATQVAAFTLATTREESRLADVLSLLALSVATVVGVGGLAWLTL